MQWLNKLMAQSKRHQVLAAIAIMFLCLLIAYIDYYVPQEVPVDILYAIPIGWATFVYARGGAIATSTLALSLFVLSNYLVPGTLAITRKELWFAVFFTAILFYGLSWVCYLLKLNQERLHRARLALEEQVAELNVLYRSSQNLVEQGLNNTAILVERLVTDISEATGSEHLHLELQKLSEFEHFLQQFHPTQSFFSVSLIQEQPITANLCLPLMVNKEKFGNLYLLSQDKNKILSQAQYAADSSSDRVTRELKHQEINSPLLQALVRHLALALQNYVLHEQSLQLAVVGERNRLAREMHDVLAQGFTGIIFQAQAATVACQDAQAVRQRLAQIEQLARYNLQEARRSVANLRPLSLDSHNLVEALQQQADNLSREKVFAEASFEISGESHTLSAEVENALYRISQEAINNAVRHSQADTIKISLDFDEDEVCLTISDNGCGFNPNSLTMQTENGRRKFGLTTMRERAKLVGGLLSVESEKEEENERLGKQNNEITKVKPTPVKGSRIRVIVPYDKMKVLS